MVAWAWRVLGEQEVTGQWVQGFLGDEGDILKLNVMMVAELCEYTKSH